MSDYISHEDMMSIPAREVSDSSTLAASPVVSVIVMTYNHEKYIAQAIEGVITQQCSFPIELLLGEDCSTDRTRDICLEYQRRYPHLIRLITAETNVGMNKNYFRLHARARGRYLAFCEGDDYWCDAYKLEKQVRMLESHHGMNVCFSRTGNGTGDRGNVITLWFRNRKAVCYKFEDLISRRVGFNLCTLCIKREALSMIPKFVEEGAMTDWPLFALALMDGYAGYIPERLGVYRLHPTGAWQSATVEYRYEGVKAMNRLLRKHLGPRYYRCFDTLLARSYCHCMERSCAESGRYGFSAVVSTLNRCPVPVWRAGRSLIAFLLHVGFPKVYAGLLATNIFKRGLP